MARHPALIAFEGIDGSGKSSVLRGLLERLRARGRDPLSLREPGGTPLGERVRGLLLDAELRRAPTAELLLFQAARAELVAEVIRPALAAGRTVISDRFCDSTRAYQGSGLGLPRETVEAAIHAATDGLEPGLVILLDVTPELGLSRSDSRGRRDAIEERAEAFLGRVREGYLELARENPEHWLVFDGARPLEELIDEVAALVVERLG